jgi:hypothetical protein
MCRVTFLMYRVTLRMYRVALAMYGVTLAMYRLTLLMRWITLAMHRLTFELQQFATVVVGKLCLDLIFRNPLILKIPICAFQCRVLHALHAIAYCCDRLLIHQVNEGQIFLRKTLRFGIKSFALGLI